MKETQGDGRRGSTRVSIMAIIMVMTGSIICGGDFKKTGNLTIFSNENSAPVAPGSGVVPGPDIVFVRAWQK